MSTLEVDDWEFDHHLVAVNWMWKVLEDDFQKANHLQKKLKRAVEKEVPEMKKQLVVLECDISRYASLQKLDSDWHEASVRTLTHQNWNSYAINSGLVTKQGV